MCSTLTIVITAMPNDVILAPLLLTLNSFGIIFMLLLLSWTRICLVGFRKAYHQTNKFQFKVDGEDTRANQQANICSKLTIEALENGLKYVKKKKKKIPEQHQWFRSGVFTVNCEHISPIFLALLLLTLNR